MASLCERFFVRALFLLLFFQFSFGATPVMSMTSLSTLQKDGHAQAAEQELAKLSPDLGALIKQLQNDLRSNDTAALSALDSSGTQRAVNGLALIAASIVLACVYGIAHDNVTARVCTEYFNSPAHPAHYRMMQRMGYENPEAVTSASEIAFKFGIQATWWVGAYLGLGIAASSQLGADLPPIDLEEFLPQIKNMLLGLGAGSCLAGLIGYALITQEWVTFDHPLLQGERKNRFFAVGCAHNTAYILGAVGGVYLVLWSLTRRSKKGMKSELVKFLEQVEGRLQIARQAK